MIPRLKSLQVESVAGGVIIHRRALERTHLADAEGSVAVLLRLLREGTRTEDELVPAMAAEGFQVPRDDIAAALAQFDEWRILERAGDDDTLTPAVRERHQSNLRFYDVSADLTVSSADQHRAVASARVLLLGAGGLGSGILQSFVGLGVGHVTLVDFDTVEIKNLARQFAYGLAAVGRRKVDAAKAWAAAYSGGTVVDAVHRRVEDVVAIQELATGHDVVVCAVDTPGNVQLLVNEACCDLGIPFVAGGLAYSSLVYWSVQPGTSACRQCLELRRAEEPAAEGAGPLFDSQPVNRATGPVVQVLSGLMAMEAMRFVRRTEAPVALACYHVLQLADDMTTSRDPWQRHPDCPWCARR
ncbi:HesA/MoeB/ThiF family protein [Actinocrispum wychmicini]|uniref:Molybdopterin/thiamine biosynthesis adenylyltransferase n=1 Tax=Actinocrispum wychmicini TaxID=1213861 RepID=A0A4R2INH3_9PSEU|nr:ThiF family adenylyltransferase [Actinocrispum wychmicini]TCO44245.1 molybdopterin/thiamine biosynthesis adenylyltransferase [Actinocrispum wychmicini]